MLKQILFIYQSVNPWYLNVTCSLWKMSSVASGHQLHHSSTLLLVRLLEQGKFLGAGLKNY